MKGKTMLNAKTLRATSVAALLLGTAGAASAADMMTAPPPPPVPTAAPMGGDSGFYLRGDVGVGVYDHASITTQPPLAGLSTLNSSIDSTVIGGVGVGYQVNSFLRGDVTGEYRFNANHRHVDFFTGPPINSNLITGKIGGFVGLANGYIDLGTWNRITPFVGAGVGVASMTMGKTTDYNLTAGGIGGTGPAKTSTHLAWAIHAGLGYDLGSNWKAEVAYRYLNIGNVNGGTVTCVGACPYYVRIKDLASHDIRFGFRYIFADAAPMGYAPGPLVRKY